MCVGDAVAAGMPVAMVTVGVPIPACVPQPPAMTIMDASTPHRIRNCRLPTIQSPYTARTRDGAAPPCSLRGDLGGSRGCARTLSSVGDPGQRGRHPCDHHDVRERSVDGGLGALAPSGGVQGGAVSPPAKNPPTCEGDVLTRQPSPPSPLTLTPRNRSPHGSRPLPSHGSTTPRSSPSTSGLRSLCSVA